MSYCVHCGVELEASLKECPLCNTPVIDPNSVRDDSLTPPYPKNYGEVERPGTGDLTLLIMVPLIATALLCYLLNRYLTPGAQWSYVVTGVCILLAVISLPVMLGGRISPYPAILMDMGGVILFMYFVTLLTKSSRWYFQVGVPIAVSSALVLIAAFYLYDHVSSSIIPVIMYVFSGVGLLCLIINIVIIRFRGEGTGFFWSGIVLAVCIIVDAILGVILFRPGLRESARKRLHF